MCVCVCAVLCAAVCVRVVNLSRFNRRQGALAEKERGGLCSGLAEARRGHSHNGEIVQLGFNSSK